MSVAPIKFGGPYAPTPGVAPLNFGSDGPPPINPATVSIGMTVAAPILQSNAIYAANINNLFEVEALLPWSRAASVKTQTDSEWGNAQTARVQNALPWQRALTQNENVSGGFTDLTSFTLHNTLSWGVGNSLNMVVDSLFSDLIKIHNLNALPWRQAAILNAQVSEQYKQLTPIKKQIEILWGLSANLNKLFTIYYGGSIPLDLFWYLPWGDAIKPPSGAESPYIPPIIPPYTPQYGINFQEKYSPINSKNVNINFGVPKIIYVPAQKVYFIVNTFSLKRVDDNTPIEIISASVGIDQNSWCWSFSAEIPYNQFEKIEPQESGPVEVELEINGILWRFLIENYNDKKVFAKTDITISGRSVTAYLENPYAPVRSIVQTLEMTSRQMAQAELERPGLVTGFDLNWQLIDPLGWLMPANTWSYSDLTPMQVIQALAQGAGGFVNSHPSQKTLMILPEYPKPFWEWDGANIAKSIPKTIIKTQNLKWMEKPLYNGVYVSGENTGVTGFVKRAGTDGAFQAPMYVSPMISHVTAARNKGMSILSAGGKQAQISLDLPMHQSIGLLTPGMLIEITNGGVGIEAPWRGLIRSTAISATRSKGLTINQSIELERHYGVF
ncbi:MAG: hypothetical protein K1X48_02285 [Burkholderiaceae bacterium]|nr:hypothetical protein [Burkholderiaceae bacterium]